MYDWSQFDIYFFIETAPETVFQRWVTPSGLESFFVKGCKVTSKNGESKAHEDIFSEGDTYEWEWFFNWKSSGTILQVIPNKQLAFTFGKCTVTVEFKSYDSGTFIHLKQNGMSPNEEDMVHLHLDCRCGWTYFLSNLKTVLEYNVDGRDKRPDTSRSLEIGFVPPQ